ncbi:hypothetical protein T439DRAFT_21679 [Meredithblackwellia eburnea MCA 4105]
MNCGGRFPDLSRFRKLPSVVAFVEAEDVNDESWAQEKATVIADIERFLEKFKLEALTAILQSSGMSSSQVQDEISTNRSNYKDEFFNRVTSLFQTESKSRYARLCTSFNELSFDSKLGNRKTKKGYRILSKILAVANLPIETSSEDLTSRNLRFRIGLDLPAGTANPAGVNVGPVTWDQMVSSPPPPHLRNSPELIPKNWVQYAEVIYLSLSSPLTAFDIHLVTDSDTRL